MSKLDPTEITDLFMKANKLITELAEKSLTANSADERERYDILRRSVTITMDSLQQVLECLDMTTEIVESLHDD